MEEKTSSQEYEFSESEDSPVRKYRPLRQILQNLDNTESDVDNGKLAATIESNTLNTSSCEVSFHSQQVKLHEKPLETENLRDTRPICSESDSAPKPFVLRTQRRVVYVWSKELIEKCDGMLKIPKRVNQVLINPLPYKSEHICSRLL